MGTPVPTVQAQLIQLDPFTLWVFWGPMNAGDVGSGVSLWAMPGMSWQFTGYSHGDLAKPNVPIMPDRSVTVYGSNDGGCSAPVFTMNANPDGMNSRMADPMRDGSNDQRFRYLFPIVGGSTNPAGPDCGIMVLCYRILAARPAI